MGVRLVQRGQCRQRSRSVKRTLPGAGWGGGAGGRIECEGRRPPPSARSHPICGYRPTGPGPRLVGSRSNLRSEPDDAGQRAHRQLRAGARAGPARVCRRFPTETSATTTPPTRSPTTSSRSSTARRSPRSACSPLSASRKRVCERLLGTRTLDRTLAGLGTSREERQARAPAGRCGPPTATECSALTPSPPEPRWPASWACGRRSGLPAPATASSTASCRPATVASPTWPGSPCRPSPTTCRWCTAPSTSCDRGFDASSRSSPTCCDGRRTRPEG